MMILEKSLPLLILMRTNVSFFLIYDFLAEGILDTLTKFVQKPINVVKDDYNQLVRDKERAAEAMQTNVFHNFPKFITASKEIGSIL
jgi:hypothetical protein